MSAFEILKKLEFISESEQKFPAVSLNISNKQDYRTVISHKNLMIRYQYVHKSPTGIFNSLI